MEKPAATCSHGGSVVLQPHENRTNHRVLQPPALQRIVSRLAVAEQLPRNRTQTTSHRIHASVQTATLRRRTHHHKNMLRCASGFNAGTRRAAYNAGHLALNLVPGATHRVTKIAGQGIIRTPGSKCSSCRKRDDVLCQDKSFMSRELVSQTGRKRSANLFRQKLRFPWASR